MSPSIRVDEEVYGLLQRHAAPFVDTPNSVLRRLLGLDAEEGSVQQAGTEQAGTGNPAPPSPRQVKQARRGKGGRSSTRGRPQKRTRAPSGSLLSEDEYVAPILQALVERGGAVPAREVVEAVGSLLKPKLTALDQERLRSGSVRWQSRVQFVRLRLVEQGLLAKDSPRGMWSVTEKGRARLAEEDQRKEGP